MHISNINLKLILNQLKKRVRTNILTAGLAVPACGEAVRPGRVKTHAGASRRSRKAS
jgi:hypothetical protein